MNLWQWIGAYAVFAIACFFVLLLMVPRPPGGPRAGPSPRARVIVIAGALAVMAMIVYDLTQSARRSIEREQPSHH